MVCYSVGIFDIMFEWYYYSAVNGISCGVVEWDLSNGGNLRWRESYPKR